VRSVFPDTRYAVDDFIAEEDWVVVQWRLLATHLGDFRGIAPTGRLEQGKLMERWVVYDPHSLLSQIQETSARSFKGEIKCIPNPSNLVC
jgi:predicted ester cyclase